MIEGNSLSNGRRVHDETYQFKYLVQGSGKTLAFGLPILQLLLAERGEGDAAADEDDALVGNADPASAGDEEEGLGGAPPVGGGKRAQTGGPLRALILAPTRELAMQVQLRRSGACAICGWTTQISKQSNRVEYTSGILHALVTHSSA